MALLDQYGKELKSTQATAKIPSRYDSAQTTEANSGYWSNSDGLSARLANSPLVRKVLRDRARYEWANNCYCHGMLRTDADYVVGTGPRVQLLTDDDDYNRTVERKFHEWATAARLGRKLWAMRLSWIRDGESFAEFVTNERLKGQVKLDLHLIECDQITDSASQLTHGIRQDDGLRLDGNGNVISYTVWPYHPGDSFGLSLGINSKPETVEANDMIHLFRLDRAGKYRGIPEITPALMLYPTMRRWTYAALGSAEKAARISGVIKSTYAPDDPATLAAMEAIYLEADSFLTLPEGWDISQMKSEQPSDTYEMFKREVIGEIARCLNMPFNIAAANSSRYNFASGKLDHLGWYKTVGIDQAQIGDDGATRIFARWFEEASRIEGHLPPPPMAGDGVMLHDYRDTPPPHVWFFDGQDTIDPREASAKDIGLKNGSETLTGIWAKRGKDAEQQLRTEAKLRGMSYEELMAGYNKSLKSQPTQEDPAEDTDQNEEQEENAKTI